MKKSLIPAALLVSLLAACASDPKNEAVVVDPNGSKINTVIADPYSGSGLPEELKKGMLANRSIYFDLDKYEIKDDYKGLVAAHANYLKGHRQFKVLVQGNTDERGSREYNLALGQKRAEAVKRNLILLGASEDQVESVSLGKEKPKNEGHNEAAWAENRRGDILYKGPSGSGEF